MELDSDRIILVARMRLRQKHTMDPGTRVSAEFFDDLICAVVGSIVEEVNHQLDAERVIVEADTQLIERASILLAERAAQK